MLDVHPINAPVHGWRDFAVHIATIVVGLWIAVGIEQLVESIHDRSRLAETRRALQLERESNATILAHDSAAWRWGTAELQNNLLIFEYLRVHPGTPQERLPGVLAWETSNSEFTSAVWDAAHQSGALSLMPREEIEADSSLYTFLQKVNDMQYETARALLEAERYDLSDPDPSHLDPAQIAEEIELTQAALTREWIRGALLANLAEQFPGFPQTIQREELLKIRHPPDAATLKLLGPAHALTMERLKTAGYPDHDNPAARK